MGAGVKKCVHSTCSAPCFRARPIQRRTSREVEFILVVGNAANAQQLGWPFQDFMPRVEDRAVDRVEVVIGKILDVGVGELPEALAEGFDLVVLPDRVGGNPVRGRKVFALFEHERSDIDPHGQLHADRFFARPTWKAKRVFDRETHVDFALANFRVGRYRERDPECAVGGRADVGCWIRKERIGG